MTSWLTLVAFADEALVVPLERFLRDALFQHTARSAGHVLTTLVGVDLVLIHLLVVLRARLATVSQIVCRLARPKNVLCNKS